MNRIIMSPRHFAPLLAALALAACATPPSSGHLATSTATASASEVETVQEMLMQGDRKDAKKRLKSLLKSYPMDARLMLLRQSMTGKPKDLLGPTSYPYTVRSGDTVQGLATRFLGNPLKAYQLARYNGLTTPVTLTAGQVLQIPGVPPAQVAKPTPERPARSAPPASAQAPAKPTPAAAPARPAANPAAAQKARSAGLAALNRGAVAEAVRLLERAHELDRNNALILRDLQRAKRIAETVRDRR